MNTVRAIIGLAVSVILGIVGMSETQTIVAKLTIESLLPVDEIFGAIRGLLGVALIGVGCRFFQQSYSLLKFNDKPEGKSDTASRD